MPFQEHIKRLKELNAWNEEVPDEILHSTSRLPNNPNSPPKYKARKAWFQAVGAEIAEGIRDGYLDQDKFLAIHRDFHKWVTETNFHKRNTTREDIDRGNSILKEMIQHLELKLKA